jgi:hypothetical protein
MLKEWKKEVKNTEDNQSQIGYTSEMRDIAESFLIHRLMLIFLLKLKLVPNPGYMILQRDFEQNTWAKLRDGE